MAKRKLCLDDDFEEIQAAQSASVHGVRCSISPLKKGRNSEYFDGELSDGTQNVRLVGFKKS